MTLEELYKKYCRSLVAVAYRMTGDWATAEDRVHDVFVVAHSKMDLGGSESELRSWLVTAVRRTTINYNKSEANRKRIRETAIIAEQATDPQQDYITSEVYKQLYHYIGELPPPVRKLFYLQFAEYHRQIEVAKILKLPYTTVKNRYKR